MCVREVKFSYTARMIRIFWEYIGKYWMPPLQTFLRITLLLYGRKDMHSDNYRLNHYPKSIFHLLQGFQYVKCNFFYSLTISLELIGNSNHIFCYSSRTLPVAFVHEVCSLFEIEQKFHFICYHVLLHYHAVGYGSVRLRGS